MTFGRRFSCIIEYLTSKKKIKFNGIVKLGFEFGDLVSIMESNSCDIIFDDIQKDFSIESYIFPATDRNFNGTFVFKFEEGEITKCAYSRAFRGAELNSFLEENYANM